MWLNLVNRGADYSDLQSTKYGSTRMTVVVVRRYKSSPLCNFQIRSVVQVQPLQWSNAQRPTVQLSLLLFSISLLHA